MGKVVELGEASERSTPGRRARRRRRSKAALVLGGGGLTGGVYEIGALRAFDLLSVDRGVNDFDVYVGTSAGSFVASMVANGVTPEEMMRVVDQQGSTPFRDMDLGTVLRPNWLEFARKGALLPLRTVNVLRELAGQIGQVSVMDVALGLAEALPSGMYTGAGLERYLHEALSEADRSDDFRGVAPELYLAATDLDTCERIVFGADGWEDVPISRAVRASTALPMVYRPVRVKGRELIDGGIVSTTNLDLAVNAGARFILVVNPLVPYVNDFAGERPAHVSEMGFPHIGYQAFKLLAYQRLHELAAHWEQRYPGVDILLIEPEPDDELMFQTNIMNFTKRRRIVRHGFESVALRLAKDFDRYEEVCARHGIEISASRLREVVKLDPSPPRARAADGRTQRRRAR